MKLEPCFLIFVRWLPREMKQEMARLICCDKLLCLADNSRKEISGRVGTKTEAAKSRKVLEWGEEAKSCQIHILRLICPRYSETKRCFCTWTFFLPGKKNTANFFWPHLLRSICEIHDILYLFWISESLPKCCICDKMLVVTNEPIWLIRAGEAEKQKYPQYKWWITAQRPW